MVSLFYFDCIIDVDQVEFVVLVRYLQMMDVLLDRYANILQLIDVVVDTEPLNQNLNHFLMMLDVNSYQQHVLKFVHYNRSLIFRSTIAVGRGIDVIVAGVFVFAVAATANNILPPR